MTGPASLPFVRPLSRNPRCQLLGHGRGRICATPAPTRRCRRGDALRRPHRHHMPRAHLPNRSRAGSGGGGGGGGGGWRLPDGARLSVCRIHPRPSPRG
eukprot:361433-Chlamydomonas_euryale.AAC.1